MQGNFELNSGIGGGQGGRYSRHGKNIITIFCRIFRQWIPEAKVWSRLY